MNEHWQGGAFLVTRVDMKNKSVPGLSGFAFVEFQEVPVVAFLQPV